MKFSKVIVLLLCVSNHVVAQNNNTVENYKYYNFKDTSSATIKQRIRIPVLCVNNPTIMDSLIRYTDEALSNGYGKYADSNGIYFSLDIGMEANDSSHLYILINARQNYYMYSNLFESLNHSNQFYPEGYRNYIMGGFMHNHFLVIVTTNQVVPYTEIDHCFFIESSLFYDICVCAENPLKKYGDGINPSIYFKIPLLDNANYTSPVEWKKALEHE